MPPVPGVKLGVARAGVKYKSRTDVLLARFEPGTAVAGVFTASTMASPAVEWCRTSIAKGGDAPEARALLVTAGNANVHTGKPGVDAVKTMAASVAQELGCRQRDTFVAQTGVIGEPMDPGAITKHVKTMAKTASSGAYEAAARAIMTTDTFPKAASAIAEIDGTPVRINGIAKGSGMIAPNMATMLAFVFTDAALPSDLLQTLLILSVRDTFNAITVDSDTSTSDTVLLFATGKTGSALPFRGPGDRRLKDFRTKLEEVMLSLAHQVVRDGEGARKFITVDVTGAESPRSARAVAAAIANSPLVKTAIAGEDANWGRIVMAVGKAGEPSSRDDLKIRFGGQLVAEGGLRVETYNEAALTKHLKGREIAIEVDLGVGSGTATMWTCDLTHGYIDINADYRS
jgi:glutamate N-acetyltransferase/amino-acid N-acetyltransferase